MFPFFMLLIYILPISKATERIVSEKETRARESMKIMGMNDTAYWLSWFCFFAIQTTVITLIGFAMLKSKVFPYSDGGLIFLYFWMYGMSQFGFVVLI